VERVVVFVTDYGLADSYAAALVAAVWRVDPTVRCVAGTHGVPPGDVLAGAYHVKALAQAFGAGAVVCAVVDPEVGTARRAIAAVAAGVGFVGPDIGLLTYLWGEADGSARRAVTVPVPAEASATFHGRDLFAPAAARLAAGAELGALGERLDDPLLLPEAFAVLGESGLVGRIAAVDHFGNAITTVRTADLAGRALAGADWEGGSASRAARTYAEIEDGLAVLVGSSGHVEIAARGSGAAGGPGALFPGATVRVLVGTPTDHGQGKGAADCPPVRH
jgi:S-adenosylmethionine hydrolase